MSACARRSRSTKVTDAAPRLSASMPTAPVPAYASSTRAPAIRGARMLKIVPRSLSDVGLSPSHVGAFSWRPFSDPAMTRIRLTHLDQPEPRLPVLNEALDCRRRRRGRIDPLRGLVLRQVQEI